MGRGLVNAHVHLELPACATEAGQGFLPWMSSWRGRVAPGADHARANAAAVAAMGTAAVIDVGNLDVGAGALAGAGLGGVAFREVFGFDVPRAAAPFANATPHALYSTHADTVLEVARRGRPWTLHVDEDEAERAFLLRGEGPWPGVLRASGRDFSGWRPPGLTPVRYLDALGVLGPDALLVHCTLTEPADLDLIALRGASVCVCPRSNLHITGRLPDVPAMLDRGIRVLVGTDSLASSPDLDVRNEIAMLQQHFPRIPASRWVRCVTDDAWAFLDRLAPGPLRPVSPASPA
jgi:cytosine/adenosine deaminase-related metal-dependent hydrolase